MENKWLSRRWIITVWSMCMITILVVISAVAETEQWATLATTLVAIPVGFTTLETLNKKHKYNQKQTEEKI